MSSVQPLQPGIKIRHARTAEFPTLARLQIQSWQDAYRGILADDYLDHRVEPDLLARWAEIRPAGDDLILVAEQDRIMGFITVWCRPAPFIDNLHVVPGQRSQGIGQRLMQAAAAQLIERGHVTVHLWVAAGNHRAIAFYRRLGGRFGEPQTQHLYGQDVAAMEVTWDDLTGLASA